MTNFLTRWTPAALLVATVAAGAVAQDGPVIPPILLDAEIDPRNEPAQTDEPPSSTAPLQFEAPPPAPAMANEAEPPAPADVDESEELEYLARGPVHEAFAEQYNVNPGPGLIVNREPPPPVDEVPPEVRPEGENVIWIPGYWAWDDDREDFIWISGLWRVSPPASRWVPGYWSPAQTADGPGWQWVSGFWVPIETDELEYHPPPPESLDYGPVGEAPSPTHFWRPGYWVYEGDYRWTPGYWAQGYDDWVWIPDRYVWTPHGCVFVPGHYDYLLTQRGFLFTPVVIPPRLVYGPAPYVYRPRYCFNSTYLGVHLFVRPRYGHYYFGDYYADHYHSRWGMVAWSNCYGGRFGYDPLLTFYVGYHRRHHGIDYCGRLNAWHAHYRNRVDARPPRTVNRRELHRHNHRDHDHARPFVVARSLDEEVRARPTQRVARVSEREIAQRRDAAAEFRKVQSLRLSTESDRGADLSQRLRSGNNRSGGQIEPRTDNGSGRLATSNGEPRGSTRQLRLPRSEAIAPRTVEPFTSPSGQNETAGRRGSSRTITSRNGTTRSLTPLPSTTNESGDRTSPSSRGSRVIGNRGPDTSRPDNQVQPDLRRGTLSRPPSQSGNTLDSPSRRGSRTLESPRGNTARPDVNVEPRTLQPGTQQPGQRSGTPSRGRTLETPGRQPDRSASPGVTSPRNGTRTLETAPRSPAVPRTGTPPIRGNSGATVPGRQSTVTPQTPRSGTLPSTPRNNSTITPRGNSTITPRSGNVSPVQPRSSTFPRTGVPSGGRGTPAQPRSFNTGPSVPATPRSGVQQRSISPPAGTSGTFRSGRSGSAGVSPGAPSFNSRNSGTGSSQSPARRGTTRGR